jgi:hypothetical protein
MASKKVVDPGVTGYSDLAVGSDKTINCIDEAEANRGRETDNSHITVARFNLAWLMSQEPPA